MHLAPCATRNLVNVVLSDSLIRAFGKVLKSDCKDVGIANFEAKLVQPSNNQICCHTQSKTELLNYAQLLRAVLRLASNRYHCVDASGFDHCNVCSSWKTILARASNASVLYFGTVCCNVVSNRW